MRIVYQDSNDEHRIIDNYLIETFGLISQEKPIAVPSDRSRHSHALLLRRGFRN